MNILLTAINAKYIHSNLAVYSLRACAGEYKEQVEIAEFTINNQKDYILEQIYKKKPDVLCFSCYIWNLDYVESVSREFHKLCPEVPIWVGGPEVSYEVEAFLQTHPQITGVMIGEGEKTFREVCGYYSNKCHLKAQNRVADAQMEKNGVVGDWITNNGVAIRSDEEDMDKDTGILGLRKISGIAFRVRESAKEEAARIVFTPAREPMDMSSIPFCYDTMEDFSNRIIYYESSRGCPFSCSYCLSSIDKKLRFRDIELVKKELQFFIDQKVPQIKFVDRTFNCNHAHAMAIWKFIKENDNGVTNFHFEISADLINEEELALISDMRPGLIQLEIGVQSTNPVTIEEIHRTMKLERLQEVVQRIQAGENIHEHLDLIAGLPYEDYPTFRKSFNEVYSWKPNQLQLGFLKVLKGSYMYEHQQKYEIIYHDQPPYEVLSTKWLSFSDVLRIKQVEEMLEVYYNSGQFEITMKLMEKLFDSAFDMFQELGAFYEENGYSGMSHSRIRRCEILLEYLQSRTKPVEGENIGDVIAMIQEALTFDLYYRENCKSRPKWAPNPAEFKHMTHRYCENGKLSHIEPFHYRFPDKSERTIAELPKWLETPVWVLFHYDQRDPLDHQAKIEEKKL